jgi:hypothetical protein
MGISKLPSQSDFTKFIIALSYEAFHMNLKSRDFLKGFSNEPTSRLLRT